MSEETRQVLEEYKKHTDKKIDEVKRHFDVCKEDTDGKIDLIIEQHGSIQKKLDGHDKRFNTIDQRMEVIKNDVEVIKVSLRVKVDMEEFEALEKRVNILESKIK